MGGAALLAAGALWIRGLALLLLWPAMSLLIVSAAYWTGRPGLLGKRGGSIHPAMLLLLAPFVAGAIVNSRLRSRPPAQEIAGGVWIGRVASQNELKAWAISSVVDLTAELPMRSGTVSYCNVPMLDLAIPTLAQLDAAVEAIDRFESQRPTLVCCALGYSRSAATIAAWLVHTGKAASTDAAIALLRERRPGVSLHAAHEARLKEWALRKGLR